MAKARVTVNDAEHEMVERARQLSKLQAKRRQKVDELAALDAEIAGVNRDLHAALPPVAPVE